MEEFGDASYFNGIASCYSSLGLYDSAEASYSMALETDGSKHVEVYTKLSKMFEVARLPSRAAPYVEKIIAIKRAAIQPKNTTEVPSRHASFSPNKASESVEYPLQNLLVPAPARKITAPPLGKRKFRAAQSAENVRLLWPQLAVLKGRFEAGSADSRHEWMAMTKILVDDFTDRKVFSSLDLNLKLHGSQGTEHHLLDETTRLRIRIVDVPMNRDECTMIPYDYCGVLMDDWLDLILEYAIRLAEDGDTATAYGLIDSVSDAIDFYHTKDSVFCCRIAWLSRSSTFNYHK